MLNNQTIHDPNDYMKNIHFSADENILNTTTNRDSDSESISFLGSKIEYNSMVLKRRRTTNFNFSVTVTKLM